MWVKICGVTRVADAECIADAGANAIGINFFPRSPRFVHSVAAAKLVAAARSRGSLSVVGVFVNATADEIIDATRRLTLDSIQFHGDETPDLIERVHHAQPELNLIRAVRLSQERLERVAQHLLELRSRVSLFAVLVDAYVKGHYGGTGQSCALSATELQLALGDARLILAGGLDPQNVAERSVHAGAWGVDTASGVESAPGIKDADKVRRFIAACRNGTQRKTPV